MTTRDTEMILEAIGFKMNVLKQRISHLEGQLKREEGYRNCCPGDREYHLSLMETMEKNRKAKAGAEKEYRELKELAERVKGEN